MRLRPGMCLRQVIAMAYRTTVNNVQIFGNGDLYMPWLDFVQSQGIPVDENLDYDGETDDFMGALAACEAIAMQAKFERDANRLALTDNGKRPIDTLPPRLQARCASPFDLTDIERACAGHEAFLFDELYERVFHGIAFAPMALYLACRDMLEFDPDGTASGRAYAFRVKPGCKIKLHAG